MHITQLKNQNNSRKAFKSIIGGIRSIQTKKMQTANFTNKNINISSELIGTVRYLYFKFIIES